MAPAAPHTAAPGLTRTVRTDQSIRFGSVRCFTPPGVVRADVWVRVAAEELVVVAGLDVLPVALGRAAGCTGPPEVARHRLSTPGKPRVDLAHYSDHPRTPPALPPATATGSQRGGGRVLALGDGRTHG